MHVVVFGASGRTGVLVTQQALAAGHDVTAVARTPAKITLRDPRLTVVPGNLLDTAFVRSAVASHGAVVSALGVPLGFGSVRIYSESARNILAAMSVAKVRRFVGLSSGGTHPGIAPGSSLFYELVIKRLFTNHYDDLRRMERLFADSDLDWTILRPPRLTAGPRTGRGRRAVGAYVIPRELTISREDLAAEVVRQLGPEGDLRAMVAVATYQ